MSVLKATRLLRSYLLSRLYPAAVSFSGDGEDRVAMGWIWQLTKRDWPDIRYLDVGACHPTRLSNTFAMYSKGARGVLVEPNPDMIGALRTKRPKDIIIPAGIAFDERRSAELHRFTEPVFNSFGSKSTPYASYLDSVSVPLIPLNDILQEHFRERPPEFLSIDAEGVDFAILRSIDFDAHKPLLICIETSSGWNEYADLLGPHGYQFICRTPDNAMFARTGS